MLPELRRYVYPTGDGGFHATGVPWAELCPRRRPDEAWTQDHADIAASAQAVLEETLLDLVRWLHGQTHDGVLTLAGGVALNCVANSRIAREGRSTRCGCSPRPVTPVRRWAGRCCWRRAAGTTRIRCRAPIWGGTGRTPSWAPG